LDGASELMAKLGGQGGVALPEFLAQLAAAATASAVLAWLYGRYGRALGNRRAFALNFVPLTITTMFVIAVVKSSLALSLGLVGALSIVRFRTAIRDPEELIYLFACIGLGLGFGANQWVASGAAFVALIVIAVVFAKLKPRLEGGASQWLLVQGAAAMNLEALTKAVEGAVKRARLTRYEGDGEKSEAAFDLELAAGEGRGMSAVLAAVRGVDPRAKCVVVDQPGRAVE
jgi:hypothetical protein